jgi:hypothetical protein
VNQRNQQARCMGCVDVRGKWDRGLVVFNTADFGDRPTPNVTVCVSARTCCRVFQQVHLLMSAIVEREPTQGAGPHIELTRRGVSK